MPIESTLSGFPHRRQRKQPERGCRHREVSRHTVEFIIPAIDCFTISLSVSSSVILRRTLGMSRISPLRS